MRADDLTSLERGVLEKLLAGAHPVLGALREQLRACRVTNREFTGCGFFTDLEVDRVLAPALINHAIFRIGDVEARIAGLENGAGFLLLVQGGYLETLEGYSYDEPWPAVITDFSLTYAGESRDLPALQFDVPPGQP